MTALRALQFAIAAQAGHVMIRRGAIPSECRSAWIFRRAGSAGRCSRGCWRGRGTGRGRRGSGSNPVSRHRARGPALHHRSTGLRADLHTQASAGRWRDEFDLAITGGHAAVGSQRVRRLPALLHHRLRKGAVAHAGLECGRQRHCQRVTHCIGCGRRGRRRLGRCGCTHGRTGNRPRHGAPGGRGNNNKPQYQWADKHAHANDPCDPAGNWERWRRLILPCRHDAEAMTHVRD